MKNHILLRHRFEYIALRMLVFALQILPYRLSLGIGGFLGRIAWHFGIRKKVSRRNFELCFGEDYGERLRDRILKKSYSNFFRSAVEHMLLPKNLDKIPRIVRFDGFGELESLISDSRGALLLTGHFGSWELFAAALTNFGCKLDVVVQTQSNRFVDDFINAGRVDIGVGVIRLGSAARAVLKSLRAGRMVAMLSDQDARDAGVVVNFFGVPASTHPGAAMLALRTKCPIVAGYIVRNPDGFTHTGFVRELTIPEKSGNTKQDIARLTQFFTDVLEEGIRKHPEQYFWAHRRFKSTLGY